MNSAHALSLRGVRHQFTCTSTESEDRRRLMYLARVFVLYPIYSITPVEDRSSPLCRPSWRVWTKSRDGKKRAIAAGWQERQPSGLNTSFATPFLLDSSTVCCENKMHQRQRLFISPLL